MLRRARRDALSDSARRPRVHLRRELACGRGAHRCRIRCRSTAPIRVDCRRRVLRRPTCPRAAPRDLAARNLGVSVDNDFALLAALGGDTAGASEPRSLRARCRQGLLGRDVEWLGRPRASRAARRTSRTGRCMPTRPASTGYPSRAHQDKLPVVLGADGRHRPDQGPVRRPRTSFKIAHRTAIDGTDRQRGALPSHWASSSASRRRRRTSLGALAGREFLLVERYDREHSDRGGARSLPPGGLLPGAWAFRTPQVPDRGRPRACGLLCAAARSQWLGTRPARRSSCSTPFVLSFLDRQPRRARQELLAALSARLAQRDSQPRRRRPQHRRLPGNVAQDGDEHRRRVSRRLRSVSSPRSSPGAGRTRGGSGKATNTRHGRRRSRGCSAGARRLGGRSLGLGGAGANCPNG